MKKLLQITHEGGGARVHESNLHNAVLVSSTIVARTTTAVAFMTAAGSARTIAGQKDAVAANVITKTVIRSAAPVLVSEKHTVPGSTASISKTLTKATVGAVMLHVIWTRNLAIEIVVEDVTTVAVGNHLLVPKIQACVIIANEAVAATIPLAKNEVVEMLLD